MQRIINFIGVCNLAVLLVPFLLWPMKLHATMITYGFSGQVTNVSHEVTNGINLDDMLHGFITFDDIYLNGDGRYGDEGDPSMDPIQFDNSDITLNGNSYSSFDPFSIAISDGQMSEVSFYLDPWDGILTFSSTDGFSGIFEPWVFDTPEKFTFGGSVDKMLATPEPSSLILIGVGTVLMGLKIRRKR